MFHDYLANPRVTRFFQIGGMPFFFKLFTVFALIYGFGGLTMELTSFVESSFLEGQQNRVSYAVSL